MFLQTDRITIQLDGILITSGHQRPYPVYVLDPTAITGWTDGVNIKRSETARPLNDGSFYDPTNFESRTIVLTGTALASSVTELHQMRDSFVKILTNKQYQVMSLTNNLDTRYAIVSLSSKTEWIQQADKVASWKLELYAPDPRIYGPDQYYQIGSSTSSAGGLKFIIKYPMNYNNSNSLEDLQYITNNGNYESWPVFKVTGDFASGFTITDSVNKEVTYSGMVTTESPVTIDMGHGTAIQNDIDRSALLIKRDWISIKPGETIRPQFQPIQAGPGWCDIIHKDTWI